MSLIPLTFGTANSGSGGSPRSIGINVGAESAGAKLLLCGVVGWDGSTDDVTSLTVGGQALSLIATLRANSDMEWQLWGGLVTTSGSQTVTSTWTGDGTYGLILSYCVFDGVDPVTPFGSVFTNIGYGTNPSIGSQTCPENGALVGFMTHWFSSTDPSYTSDGTSLVAIKNTYPLGIAYRLNDGGHSWYTGTSNQDWSVFMLPVNGVAPVDPVITGPSGAAGDAAVAVTVAENQTSIGTWTASDSDTWGVSGTDAARVQISVGGVVSFVAAPNFEAPDDADANGVYLFNVTNGVASQAVTVTLTDVNEPPGPPTGLVATAGNSNASVTFEPPAPNGGPSVTSYTVTSSPGGLTGTGSASPILVTGLTNGVAYTFTATATNPEGTSSASAASNEVTPAAVLYSITSPAGGFASNTGSTARAAGETFNWWAFAAKVIGDSLAGATLQTGSGTLNGSGLAVLPALTAPGEWECQVRFADGGTARWTGTAA